ncbi:hypothetical protein BU26DRAFT_500755 [Trematosphaeria pertusa]|uniref:Uncharacterized protein n=1 Tax=Trematosphaeria pertusa TaxID=390896 RepID=A0A6A6IYZ0_9PLEO|nr:uncharacterized protein BU26DRAFT_500755 [Trematosphaeria pertusa]KAF2255132.1 hypothetical protein BU26DRAFT_500755 [Trematosphaeria pertusa]
MPAYCTRYPIYPEEVLENVAARPKDKTTTSCEGRALGGTAQLFTKLFHGLIPHFSVEIALPVTLARAYCRPYGATAASLGAAPSRRSSRKTLRSSGRWLNFVDDDIFLILTKYSLEKGASCTRGPKSCALPICSSPSYPFNQRESTAVARACGSALKGSFVVAALRSPLGFCIRTLPKSA